MSWTLTKQLDTFAGPGEIKRREVVLGPQVSPEEIKSWEVELGLRVGLLSLQLFPSCGATDIVFVTLFRTAVETATAKYTSCCAMASGHSRNIFVVLAAVHGSLGLPGWRLSRGFSVLSHLFPLRRPRP